MSYNWYVELIFLGRRKKLRYNILEKILSFTISFLSFLFAIITYDNYDTFLAKRGVESQQIVVADEARRNFDYSKALNYYGMIVDRDDIYSPYAALAKLEIYNDIISDYKDWEDILNCFSVAVKSQDSLVLRKCLNIVLSVGKKQNNPSMLLNNAILSKDNLENITELLNGLYNLQPEIFSDIEFMFPITSEKVDSFFLKFETLTIEKYRWKYVATITSDKSGLGYVHDDEKVILVGISTVPISELSTVMVNVYTYYKYEKVVISNTQKNIYEILTNESIAPIYLSSLTLTE